MYFQLYHHNFGYAKCTKMKYKFFICMKLLRLDPPLLISIKLITAVKCPSKNYFENLGHKWIFPSLSLSPFFYLLFYSHVLFPNYIQYTSQINSFVIPYIHNEIEMCHPHCNYMQLSKCGTLFFSKSTWTLFQ